LKNLLETIKKWSIDNKDFVSLCRAVMQAVLIFVAVIAFLYNALNTISIHKPGSWFDKTISFLTVSFVIPLYLLLLVVLAGSYFYKYVAKRSAQRADWKARLVGTWLNQWGGTQPGRESFEINNRFQYIVNGKPYFEVRNFRIKVKKKQVSFTKVAIQNDDTRIVHNILAFDDFNVLRGTERSKSMQYPISYTRVGSDFTKASDPYIKMSASATYSSDTGITYPLKIQFQFECLQNNSIAVNSIRFEANPILQIERKAQGFHAPNSYNANATLFTKEQYHQEVIISKTMSATCWIPFDPTVGKNNLDIAIEKGLCGILYFNYYFLEDRSKSHLYIGKF
jgi:hypothetical protein